MNTSTHLYLTASDFASARTCVTKLYYRKSNYPSLTQSYREEVFITENEGMLKAVAQQLFPDGQEIGADADVERMARETMAALDGEAAVVFEGVFISGGKLCQSDIVVRRGNEIDVIDVLAKAYKSTAHEERIRKNGSAFRSTKEGQPILAKWTGYLERVAFQVSILQALFPECEITPFLMMPDKAKMVPSSLCYSQFVRHVDTSLPGIERLYFEFIGDGDKARQEHFLTTVNVKSEADLLLAEVEAQAADYVRMLRPALHKIESPLSQHCRSCEFRVGEGGQPNGFEECWGKEDNSKPHLFDLHRAEPQMVNRLIQEGKFSLFDVDTEQLVTSRGRVGKDNQRQRIQIEHMRSQSEWFSRELPLLLRSYLYPLHFIDFEVSSLAVPYHAGLAPYDPIAFQWSCHTLRTPESEPEHYEWLNMEDSFPNFRFAEALMAQIGNEGTIFAWGRFEDYILSQIWRQMKEREYEHLELQAWLERTARRRRKRKGRIRDMNALVRKHYFHPLMRGRTALKQVVEALWQSNPSLHHHYPAYLKEKEGKLLTPYQTLPTINVRGRTFSVADGPAAVYAYQQMLYTPHAQPEEKRQAWGELLRRYCELDSLAMVMLWWHWHERLEVG